MGGSTQVLQPLKGCKENGGRDFPGPEVRTPPFQCRVTGMLDDFGCVAELGLPAQVWDAHYPFTSQGYLQFLIQIESHPTL